MGGNNIYVQGSYIDVHDNENVYLSVDKAEVTGVDLNDNESRTDKKVSPCVHDDEELFHFIYPSVQGDGQWQIHSEVKHLVSRQGIQEICAYLKLMADEKKILLPQSPSVAYAELVRMGMPSGEGFNESTFRKYYDNK